MFGFWPARRADISPETLVRTLRQHGIDGALTLSTHGIFADFAVGNSETMELCSKAGGLLKPVGTVDPRRFVGGVEAIKQLSGQGVKAWRLFPELQDWTLDSRAAELLLATIKEVGGLLLIDAAESGAPSRIAARVTALGLPTVLLGVSSRLMGELLALLDDAPRVYLETRRLADPEVLVALARRFGVERLLFGTASPLQYVSSARLAVETAPLSDEQRAQVLGGNLARLLGEGS
jgi:predicted TIM-barrel fold metal-dependent hydrolase